MRGAILRRLALVLLVVVAAAGVSVASADGTTSAGLYSTASGSNRGTISVLVSGGTMQITVNAVGLTANTAYSVCVTDPLTYQTWGCQPIAAPGLALYGGFALSPACALFFGALPPGCFLAAAPTAGYGTLSTDPSGKGTSSLTLGVLMPNVVVVVTSYSNTADVSTGQVNTGATPLQVCFGAC
jgi:hypothetical protein